MGGLNPYLHPIYGWLGWLTEIARPGMMLASGPTRRKTVKKDDVRSGGLDDKEAGAGAGESKNVVEGNGELAEAENGANFQAMKKRERSDEFVLEYLVGACGADATQQVLIFI